jgi:hypothetical protein
LFRWNLPSKQLIFESALGLAEPSVWLNQLSAYLIQFTLSKQHFSCSGYIPVFRISFLNLNIVYAVVINCLEIKPMVEEIFNEIMEDPEFSYETQAKVLAAFKPSGW